MSPRVEPTTEHLLPLLARARAMAPVPVEVLVERIEGEEVAVFRLTGLPEGERTTWEERVARALYEECFARGWGLAYFVDAPPAEVATVTGA